MKRSYAVNPSKLVVHDDYTTPKQAWADIIEYLPKDKVIWEPFYCNGSSGRFLTELGLKVIHRPNEDFFEHDHGDIVVTNPPFSKKKEILERLVLLGKPFVMIMPHFTLTTQFFMDMFADVIQIIVPRRRINFMKIVDGLEAKTKSTCAFDCLYFCYKMNLERDIIFVKNKIELVEVKPDMPKMIVTKGKNKDFIGHVYYSTEVSWRLISDDKKKIIVSKTVCSVFKCPKI